MRRRLLRWSIKLATCQTLSGTGSLHLAGKIIKYCQQSPISKVYIPSPTWSNHHLVFSSLGFECKSFQYYDTTTKKLDITSYLSTLSNAEPGSIVILHACAHNPTGLDPSPEQWKEIGTIIKKQNLFPLFDAAYLGFNSGDFAGDAFAIRYFVNELGLEAAVCLSFAKNMGLYGSLFSLLPPFLCGSFFLRTNNCRRTSRLSPPGYVNRGRCRQLSIRVGIPSAL